MFLFLIYVINYVFGYDNTIDLEVNDDYTGIDFCGVPLPICGNDCKIDFEVTLSMPGDFYEFTVDVVNAGSIDAMIDTLEKTLKVNNVVVETIPDYLNFTVTYDDGDEILESNIESYFVWIPKYSYQLWDLGSYTGLTTKTTSEIKCGIYVILCTILEYLTHFISLIRSASIMGAGKLRTRLVRLILRVLMIIVSK